VTQQGRVLSAYRQEENALLVEMRTLIREIETKIAICEAVEQLSNSGPMQNYRGAVEKLRDGYLRSAMDKNDTEALQRAAALDEQLRLLTSAREQKEHLARELEEAKNQWRLSTVKVGEEERIDPSGGLWRS